MCGATGEGLILGPDITCMLSECRPCSLHNFGMCTRYLYFYYSNRAGLQKDQNVITIALIVININLFGKYIHNYKHKIPFFYD